MHQPTRLVVLVSGSGTNLQALLDACADPSYGARVVAVGADREDIEGLARAERAGIPTFVRQVSDFETREGWDASLTTVVERFEPDLVVSAGFMKLLSTEFLDRFLTLNTHPALCPAFPGMHGPRDALDEIRRLQSRELCVETQHAQLVDTRRRDARGLVAQPHQPRRRVGRLEVLLRLGLEADHGRR